jgi:hypothetical protein
MAHYRIYELDSAITLWTAILSCADRLALQCVAACKLGEAGEKYHVQVIAVRDCADRNGRGWDFGAVSWCRGSWRRSRRMLL